VEEQLRAAEQNRILARKISLALFALILVMGAFIIWAAYDYTKAVRQEIRDAETNVYNELFGAAIPVYEKLADSPRRKWVLESIFHKNVEDELDKTRSMEHLYRSVEDSLTAGDTRFFNFKNYVGALNAYHHAIDTLVEYKRKNNLFSEIRDSSHRQWFVDQNRIQNKNTALYQRVESARQITSNQFKIAQRDYETFNEAHVWNMAYFNLHKMKDLLPDHPTDIENLRKELNLNEPPRNYVLRELAKCKIQLQNRGVSIPEN
jgi:hypothetical protein